MIFIITNATPSTVIGIMIHIPDMDSAFILDMAAKDDIAMVSDFTSVIDTTADMGPTFIATNIITVIGISVTDIIIGNSN